MALSNRLYSEKRGFIRMVMDTPASLSHGEPRQTFSVHCRNLSSSGIMIEYHSPLPVGDRVEITIPSERPEFPDFKAEAEVIRSDITDDKQSEEDETLYQIALKIHKII
ncbi:PilZ domain-containing protein [Spartinivicinus ruber]|uniref:PilZ domain-containing protein n=1 Tax=Spartinivicinus ruber TaxID=2683272 RepID=UPI0013CF817C|nr:PilZ domain-containing protein [Spartinivicinus ruber]